MLNLEIKNHLELNIDSKYTKEAVVSNSLDVNNCLFTPELLTILLRSNRYNKNIYKNKEGVYLIAFGILNKEKRSLIYNFIYYNDLLYLTLIVYFMVRNYYITENDHEWGKYLVVMDNKFLNYINVDKYIDLYNTKDKAKHKS